MAKWGTYPPDEQLRLKREAAEEMYEALRKIVAPYDRDGSMTGERYSDAVWIAKAALTQATGESA